MQVSTSRVTGTPHGVTGPAATDETEEGAIPDVEEAGDLAEVFRLLGSPKRIRLLYALAASGEMCVSDLAAAVGIGETAVSQSLRLLRTAGVVRKRRDGRNIRYRLDDEHVAMVLDVSRAHLSHRLSDRLSDGEPR